MNETRTETEYAIYGKTEDGLWYKVNSKEIGSHAAARKKVSEFLDSPAGSSFVEYKIMERTVTITTSEWSETK